MTAGATAVHVGTANFVVPLILDKILGGIRSYMERHNISRLAEIVGTVNDHAHS
jgi:dihydroorotate dehydrogenase (NAD+) catalytic subunit